MSWANYPAYESLVVPFVCDGDAGCVMEVQTLNDGEGNIFGNIRRQITIGEMVERYNHEYKTRDYSSLYPKL